MTIAFMGCVLTGGTEKISGNNNLGLHQQKKRRLHQGCSYNVQMLQMINLGFRKTWRLGFIVQHGDYS